jgi:hypothetical protein
MATQNERLQRAWHTYEDEREHKPASARQAVEWAVAEGLLELPEIDPYDVLAEQMAAALREEYKTDEQGRRYRVNHAVRVTSGGVQFTFWAIMGYAPHDHMERAFAQRREMIIGNAFQLRTDVDVYNDMNRGVHPEIQMILDFTDDVAERQAQMAKPKVRTMPSSPSPASSSGLGRLA